jgi:uncharacterized protein YutE (UPF0331/DUF86 family)
VVDKERVSRLLDSVRSALAFLKSWGAKPADDLAMDEVALAAVKYRFVTAIEGCVKVAQHMIASEGWSVPETNAAAIRELGRHGVVEPAVADSAARAVGFRNVLVHQYADVDDLRVIAQLAHLDDLDAYVAQVAAWLLTAPPSAGDSMH